jgi:uncharacterized protein
VRSDIASVTTVHVTSLHVHPVKSTRGSAVTQAVVEPWGLAGDRRWMVVDADGGLVTARVASNLLHVTAHVVGEAELWIEGPHAPPITVTGTEGEAVRVRVWDDVVAATWPTAEADAWFGELLEREVRLVWLDDPTVRRVNPSIGRPDDYVSFADGYPLLLTTTASLRQLNEWADEEARLRGEGPPTALVMERFRPSVVVDTEVPFAEDSWRQVVIGTTAFRAVKGCDRCAMTTIDPDTLVSGKEPIRTLARHRKWNGKVWFGVNLVPDDVGTIAVGDVVDVNGRH